MSPSSQTPGQLSPERLTEIKSLLRYESSISFHSARAKESLLLLVDEVVRQATELEKYEVLNPQQCPKGVHADWLIDSEHAYACPWCEMGRLRSRVTELERPAIEAKRTEIRSSYGEIASQAEQDKDFEGAAHAEHALAAREAQWAREDAAKGGA